MAELPRMSFLRAFFSSVLGTGLSRVFGALRVVVIAGVFGASSSTDAFFLACTIPDVFRRFVADEGLTGAMIPALAKTEQEAKEDMPGLANTVLGALLLVNVALCALAMIFAEPIVLALAWDYASDPVQLQLTTTLTRMVFPFLGMVSLVSFFEGLLNHKGHFFVPKVAPGLVSLGIVFGAWFLTTPGRDPSYALAVGLLLGGAAHVLIHVPVLTRLWGPIRPAFGFSSPRFKRIGREMLKVVAIGIMAQVNILVLRQLAVSVGTGGLSWYWNAHRLVDLTQGIIAVAIGSALLPQIARSIASKEWSQFRVDFVGAVRLAGFLLIPTAGAVVVFGAPMVSMLFRWGAYSVEDMNATALTLQAMAPFLLAVAGINLVKRVYFALNDRVTLLWVGGFGVVLTGSVGWVLVQSHGIPGLGMALSISTALQLAVYLWLLHRRLRDRLGLRALASPLATSFFASIPSWGVLWLAAHYGQWGLGPTSSINWICFLLGGVGSLTAFGWCSHLLRIEEFTMLMDRVRQVRLKGRA